MLAAKVPVSSCLLSCATPVLLNTSVVKVSVDTTVSVVSSASPNESLLPTIVLIVFTTEYFTLFCGIALSVSSIATLSKKEKWNQYHYRGKDKAIQKASRINPAKAVMLQAAGAMFIEEYCNYLENFLLTQEKKTGNSFKPRFSPGYADVKLETQKIFFELLQCQKNIALTLNDSLIMSPEKSVTAFIGVKKNEQ